METHISPSSAESSSSTSSEFNTGSAVIYALHGKCNVVGLETRDLGGRKIRFYKLEVQKSALSRSTRQEPAIWIPVETSREKGLRAPMNREQAEAAFAILSNREYYFQPSENWSSVYPKLENCIRLEGANGLAKVYSFLHVLRRKQIVPTPEVNRFFEVVSKLLTRELCEALDQPLRPIEDRITKSLRAKNQPDH